MKEQSAAAEDQIIQLKAPAGTPFTFSVLIREGLDENKAGFILEVSGPLSDHRESRSCRYTINHRDHNAYLNLFAALAADFGLRLPQNRQASPQPTATYPYTEVLRNNLASGMIYGYGDPAVIRVEPGAWGAEARYYLLATSNDAADSFPILRSSNLKDWEFVNYVFPQGQKPAWAADGPLVSDYWAPEMHQVGQEFRVYFVARDKHSRELCIGMARSESPEGPFRADPGPVLQGNVIDPHLFVEADGTSFLYWKADNNDLWPTRLNDLLYENPDFIAVLFPEKQDQLTACFVQALWPWARSLEPMERFLVLQVLIEAVIARYTTFYSQLEALLVGRPTALQEQIRAVLEAMKTPVFAQQLSENGSTLVGARTKIIENDLEWEAHLVEGMWLTKQGEHYYLFYAGNDFSTDQYGIGVAIADAPLGPYRKMMQPFLQSTAEWWAPGHPSLVVGPDGRPQLFLHAFFPGHAGYKQFRALLSVPLTFAGDQVYIATNPPKS